MSALTDEDLDSLLRLESRCRDLAPYVRALRFPPEHPGRAVVEAWRQAMAARRAARLVRERKGER